MERKALIIYCDNTTSGRLVGPSKDYNNYHSFLLSNLGGNWYSNEIISLHNPHISEVSRVVNTSLNNADYTFIIFTGHGFINTDDSKQYVELADGDIPIAKLKTNAKRQTMIIDACRGRYSLNDSILSKAITDSIERFSAKTSTRALFDKYVLRSEEGLTILYAADENQSAADTNNGGAYLLSLLAIAKQWEKENKNSLVLDLKDVHNMASKYVLKNFETIQRPVMNNEKRRVYFPFAVKYMSIYG
jgi:regulator of extracellular matrix RemA (YlzA/DUF370 family)